MLALFEVMTERLCAMDTSKFEPIKLRVVLLVEPLCVLAEAFGLCHDRRGGEKCVLSHEHREPVTHPIRVVHLLCFCWIEWWVELSFSA